MRSAAGEGEGEGEGETKYGPQFMTEYRTKPMECPLLRVELAAVCEAMRAAGAAEALVSFGWDSNLSNEEMWKVQSVPVDDVMAFVAESERCGVSRLGASDIFIESSEFLFTLCHEGDVHVRGGSPLVEQFARRWESLGYAPYPVRHAQGEASEDAHSEHAAPAVVRS